MPALLFFFLAVLLSVPVARRLGGREAALLLPPLLAAAPLAVRLSTFGRMYTVFLAGVLLAVWLLLRATEGRGRSAWIVAGLAAGSLVYVHPIAPLYIGLALATAYLHAGVPARQLVRSALPGLLALAAVAAPYVYTLAVLGERYGIGSSDSALLSSTSGRPVAVESLLALTPGERLGAGALGALALFGLLTTIRGERGAGIALGLWLAAPITFFSLVPSETVFFARYLLPALPFFLLLVALGCLALGRFARRPALVAGALVAAIVIWEAAEAAARVDRLRDHRLTAIAGVAGDPSDLVVFSSTGGPVAGRPSELLDAYAALELPGATRVEELPGAEPDYTIDIHTQGAAAVRDFLASERGTRRGVWLFSGRPRRLDLASRRLGAEPDLEVHRISPGVLLVRSREPLPAGSLIEQAILVRSVWLGERGRDRWAEILIDIDRAGLAEEL